MKKKFKPIITRVKLNPEQAVLACSCFDVGFTVPFFDVPQSGRPIGCIQTKTKGWNDTTNSSTASS